MIPLNLLRTLKPVFYGHSYGSNANPKFDNARSGCNCSAALKRAQKAEDKVAAALELLKKAELQRLCRKLGLKTHGTKADLRERIQG